MDDSYKVVVSNVWPCMHGEWDELTSVVFRTKLNCCENPFSVWSDVRTCFARHRDGVMY